MSRQQRRVERKPNKVVAQEWIDNQGVQGRIEKALSGDTQQLVQLARLIGHESYNRRLTTNQIRNIFGMVKEWEMKYLRFEADSNVLKHELTMLMPKLVYAASRHDEVGTWIFAITMQQCVERILQLQDVLGGFRIFTNFFEAILAYHKEAEAESRKRRQGGGA